MSYSGYFASASEHVVHSQLKGSALKSSRCLPPATERHLISKAGRELLMVVELKPMPLCLEKLNEFFTSRGLVMTEVDTSGPQIVNAGLP